MTVLMSAPHSESAPGIFAKPVLPRGDFNLPRYDTATLTQELFYRIGGERDFVIACKALRLAEVAHQDQGRREGKPYVVHPLRVAIRFIDSEKDRTGGIPPMKQIATAVLHDVLEDSTEISPEQIENECGTDVLRGVQALTKVTKGAALAGEKADIPSYFLNLADGKTPEYVRRLKVFDKIDNIWSLLYLEDNPDNPGFTRNQIQEAREYSVPLASFDPQLQSELLQVIEMVESKTNIIAK